MGSCYKTFRISQEEDELIQKFLNANPLFDFSTLARAAIRSFVEKPELVLKGVSVSPLRQAPSKSGPVRKKLGVN